ncbi:fibronectin type III domain-containing protein [Patescibacteria group bacterium]|nr:fibronectin type III domain-containing protein [Patescibacteria group bacterium]
MKRNLILITVTLLIMLIGNTLTFAQQSDATLEFRASTTSATTGQEFDVDVYMKNPGAQNVISVRSWLKYDPSALEGVSITTSDSDFTLSAPGEDNFSSSEGYVKIGRSNISGGVSATEMIVAKVRFKVKTATGMTTEISSHDYQVTELGHTSINIIEDGFPVNILSEKPDSVTITLNGGTSATTPEPVVTEVTTEIGGSDFDLQRPQNLKANTGYAYVDLRWDIGEESDLNGYNIYYGKTSGHYSRRKTVSKVNSYRIDGLNNGEAYYFAITAYDNSGRESDYSDEVGVIVNEPLSSTSPFEDILAALLAFVPEQPQNGPIMGWVLFSAVGLGGTLMFRKKRQQ